jgi:hypothetical protein
MTAIKKEKIRTLSVTRTDAFWYNVDGKWDRKLHKRVGGYEKLGPAKLNLETQTDWVQLSIRDAEKLVKVLKKEIKKAKASSTAAKGDK